MGSAARTRAVVAQVNNHMLKGGEKCGECGSRYHTTKTHHERFSKRPWCSVCQKHALHTTEEHERRIRRQRGAAKRLKTMKRTAAERAKKRLLAKRCPLEGRPCSCPKEVRAECERRSSLSG